MVARTSLPYSKHPAGFVTDQGGGARLSSVDTYEESHQAASVEAIEPRSLVFAKQGCAPQFAVPSEIVG
jgi:hypothetical protein